jgi:hypothetical protein
MLNNNIKMNLLNNIYIDRINIILYIITAIITIPITTIYYIIIRQTITKINLEELYDNTIFIPGIFGWTPYEKFNILLNYYDTYFTKIKCAKVGPINNYYQRSCEFIASVYGYDKIQYGLVYSKKTGIKQYQINLLTKQKLYDWSQDKPINIICHSAGCIAIQVILIRLYIHEYVMICLKSILLDKDYKNISLDKHYNNSLIIGDIDVENKFNSLYINNKLEIIEYIENKLFKQNNNYYTFIYDDNYNIPNKLNIEAINKIIYISPSFKGATYLSNFGIIYNSITKKLELISNIFYKLIIIIYILFYYCIPKTFYDTYIDIYDTTNIFTLYNSILKSSEILPFDLVQEESAKVTNTLINLIKLNKNKKFFINKNYFILTNKTINIRYNNNIYKILSPVGQTLFIGIFTLFGNGWFLDYNVLYNNKKEYDFLNSDYWTKNIDENDGILSIDSMLYYPDKLNELNIKYNLIYVNEDHISVIGILSANNSSILIWKNAIKWLKN